MTHNNRRKKPESCVLSPPQLLKNPAKSLEFTAESRLSSLKQTLHAVYTKILEDPMTKVLSNDHTSCEFVTARVNEIFNESIDNEREHYYSSLFEKYLQENLELRDQLLEVLLSFIKILFIFTLFLSIFVRFLWILLKKFVRLSRKASRKPRNSRKSSRKLRVCCSSSACKEKN